MSSHPPHPVTTMQPLPVYGCVSSAHVTSVESHRVALCVRRLLLAEWHVFRSVHVMVSAPPPLHAEGHSPVWVDTCVDTWVVYTGNGAVVSKYKHICGCV